MAITPQSAIIWLADEIQSITASLVANLEEAKSLLDTQQREQLDKLLIACKDKVHSISGALDVAHNQPLVCYVEAMKKVIRQWQESPQHLTLSTVYQIQSACWGLHDFSKAVVDNGEFSELALFHQYQKMAAQVSQSIHPMDLWRPQLLQDTVSIFTQSEILNEFQVSQPTAITPIGSGNNDQLDALMLGLIRYKQAEVADQLQALCHLRAATETNPEQAAFGTLLSMVIQVLSQGDLSLDLYLKRFLLASLRWLKGEPVDGKQLLNEASFFSYVAWQRRPDTVSPALARLAQHAKWSMLPGSTYTENYFLPETRQQLLRMIAAIDQLQITWTMLCGTLDADKVDAIALGLPAQFEPMAKILTAVYPSSKKMAQTLYAAMTNPASFSARGVQVEVATALLMLKSIAHDGSALDSALAEERFETLHQRIVNVCQGVVNEPLQPWMADLEQRDHWLQAVASSRELIEQKLTEIENIFKHIWAYPGEAQALELVPEKLQQISSVAYSLGLNHFATAIEPVHAKVVAIVDKNLSMDDQLKEGLTSDLALLGLMLTSEGFDITPDLTHDVSSHAPITAAPSELIEDSYDDDDVFMKKVFLDEALEVIASARRAIEILTNHPKDEDAKDELRRSFHTLKGSARIVGLTEYGESAWMLEKHFNDTVFEGQPISHAVLAVCEKQLDVMSMWTRTLQTENASEISQIDWQLETLAREIQNIQVLPTFVLPPADFLDLSPAISPVTTTESQFKTVGDLEISIPLYQAYLNETDEWSRQLALALSEWALDPMQPIPAQALAWAHAIGGSSATVGFSQCANLAKLVERVIEHVQVQSVRSPELAQTLSFAADDIGRLLHQFAAGFIKTPDAQMMAKLESYLTIQFEPSASDPLASTTSTDQHDEEMRQVFQEETTQLIPELGAALRGWERSPSSPDYKTQALRVLHTLKGSARLVGEQRLAQRAHDLESQIEALDETPSLTQLSQLLNAYDQLLDSPEPVQPATPNVKATRIAFAPVASSSSETIRIQSGTVDRLVNQTGEIMAARARMESEMTMSLRTLSDLGAHVQRLRDQLRELELQTESQMQSRRLQVSELANSFDPLELDRFTRTQELTRFMAEALGDVSSLQRGLQRSLNATEDDLAAQLRQTRDLQRHLLHTRMVEFESISERLHRLVRMTSQEVGKTVEFVIHNSRQELDRSVLERVLPAFEHILRNAVVHGIEAPHERIAKGKPEQGQIHIELAQQSNDVMVILRDNGRGLDKEALMLKAKKLVPHIDPNMDPAELIFMSGLTTASEVSELAGRGIGLDVVRAQVQALGGRVQVEFVKDVGTTFKLILPLTMAVTQIVLVRSGSVMTGIPSNLVVSVVRAKVQEIMTARETGHFKNGAQTYPFHELNQLLLYKASSNETDSQGTLPVMLLQSAGQIVALYVDEVLGNQEVMIKNLGLQLAQMPGLSGMTVLPAGAIVLIYNPVALASVYGNKVSERTKAKSLAATNQEQIPSLSTAPELTAPLVLVVDDSITMRRVLQRLLQREGYRVTLAADGRQALDSLRLEKPVLVLSDVEMPRMNGFELLESIRANDKLQDLPVVMITSRIADKHRDHAKTLGANEYLGKPYSEEELIDVLERYARKS